MDKKLKVIIAISIIVFILLLIGAIVLKKEEGFFTDSEKEKLIKYIQNVWDSLDWAQQTQLNNEWEMFLITNKNKIKEVIELNKKNEDFKPLLICLINSNKLDPFNIDRLTLLIIS